MTCRGQLFSRHQPCRAATNDGHVGHKQGPGDKGIRGGERHKMHGRQDPDAQTKTPRIIGAFTRLERDKRLELSTYTLARYRSTN